MSIEVSRESTLFYGRNVESICRTIWWLVDISFVRQVGDNILPHCVFNHFGRQKQFLLEK